MHYGLTKLQKRVLDFIAGYITENGYSPSFDEMKDAVGIKSKSNIHRIICALESRGYIHRIPASARSIIPASFEVQP